MPVTHQNMLAGQNMSDFTCKSRTQVTPYTIIPAACFVLSCIALLVLFLVLFCIFAFCFFVTKERPHVAKKDLESWM